jgi:hypothetical protein
MHSRTAWNDYFTGNPTLMQSTLFEEIQTPSETVYILNCLFISITSTSAGGALYCNSVTCLLVESTSFFSCKANGRGGAIYFHNISSGQSVYYEVCAYDCCSTGGLFGQFSYNILYDDPSTKNYINYSSIVRCGTVISNPAATIDHHRGTHCYLSVNMSMNKCYDRSGISDSSSNSNSFACSISYSSFTDNIATSHNCIQLRSDGAKYEIKNCNIIRNKQGDLGTQGTIYTCGITNIENSCILENKATYIFRQYSSYAITLSNCTVDSTSSNGYLTTRNTVTKSFIHALNHMSTQNCHSEYDSAAYLTPIIQSPTSSKKQKLYYSREICFLQARLSDVVSLANILIFNFIYPYSSSSPLF